MCTAVIEVPQSADGAVRLLAVRDEDPSRAWDAPGAWWPKLPRVVGVRDRLAGGAWLAAESVSGRIAMILNRAENGPQGIPQAPNEVRSRGALVLEQVAGGELEHPPRTANFNLVSVRGSRAVVTSWDGRRLSRVELTPGMHMIAHHDVNDAARTPRIAHWLPQFRQLTGLPDSEWREQWIARLSESARLAADDDRAIIRDNRVHGYETLSLLCCLISSRTSASSTTDAPMQIDTAIFDEPGHWKRPEFRTLRV